MKKVLLVFHFMVCFFASAAFAQEKIILNSDNVDEIKVWFSTSNSGEKKTFRFNENTAVCTANTMAEIPGYHCEFSTPEAIVLVTNVDINLIDDELKSLLVSGAGKTFFLESGDQVYCSNNTFAELPGYKCSL